MRIGILGTGTITSAVVQGIAEDGHRITVSARNAARAARLAGMFDCVEVAENQAVIDASEVVILGLMQEVAEEELGALTFRADQQVISVMAGVNMARFAALVAPATAAAIMMPFPGIAQGGPPLMMHGDADLVGQLFGARNPIYPLATEAELDAYICAQAVVSPAAMLVAETADWLSSRVSDPVQGEAFLRGLVATSLAGMESRALIAALNTEGGYNQRLRQHMERAGMAGELAKGLDRQEGKT